ncbi:hypothetical protein M8J76_015225 [Diaphorina citri]|nr:hypothetical protein M8J75_016159 [Diaphorina citri]KAI5719814.1 hypothetical protein M8J76_015225 [Diaphorina citri]KAI5721743.1 hypothetical protein M8J77_025249 [Diaphorina citri]
MPQELDKSDEEKLYYIISEVYDGDSDGFELQLDNALDENYKIIIIEPSKLGDETTRWIAVGNWIHKVAVFSGLGSITVGFVCPTKPVLYLPLYVISLLSVGLYTISWQLDPCCKYKVTDKSILTKFHIEQKQLSSPSSTILLKTSIASTIWLHNIVLITATGICAYKFYKSM